MKIPRKSRPVPTRRNKATAIWQVTIVVRRRLCEWLEEELRPPSLRLLLTSVREAFRAGARPQRRAQSVEAASAKSRTFESRLNGTALMASLKFIFARTKAIPQ